MKTERSEDLRMMVGEHPLTSSAKSTKATKGSFLLREAQREAELLTERSNSYTHTYVDTGTHVDTYTHMHTY